MKSWLYVALITVGLLVAAELLSRVVRQFDIPDPLVTESNPRWVSDKEFDPHLFWKLRPGIVRNGIPVTNSLGLRGPEIPRSKGDEFRILSLGESSTYAGYLPHEETYSALLEDHLGSISGKPVRVINAGAPGYTLHQGFVFFSREGLSLQPDAVIVYFGYNDFLPVAMRVKRDRGANTKTYAFSDRRLYEERQKLPFRIAFHLAQRSNLVRYLLFHRHRDGLDVGQCPDTPRVPEEDRRDLLDSFRAVCRDKGILFIVVIPWYLDEDRYVPLLREYADFEDVVLVDLPETLPDATKSWELYFKDPVHPTAEGHRLIARAIADKLDDIPAVGGAR